MQRTCEPAARIAREHVQVAIGQWTYRIQLDREVEHGGTGLTGSQGEGASNVRARAESRAGGVRPIDGNVPAIPQTERSVVQAFHARPAAGLDRQGVARTAR